MYDLLLSRKFLIPTLTISIVYIVFTIYLMNARLVGDTILGEYSILYKVSLLFSLLKGIGTAMSTTGLLILFFIALLTGANLTLLWQKIKEVRKMENLHLVVGGNTLLGIVGSGCATCSLPILALLGLSGSLIYLPFHGAELSYLSVILLSISFYLLTRSILDQQSCVLPAKKRKHL